MDKMPDYIGRWLVDGDRGHIDALGGKDKYELVSLVFNHGHFTFFIDERKSINNLTERVKGRIYDALGEASFEGEIIRDIGKDTIKFVKRYNKNVLMLLKIVRPSSTALTMEVKLSSRRIISDASLATSVPAMHMAIPISALFSAGASLTPSPVIAT